MKLVMRNAFLKLIFNILKNYMTLKIKTFQPTCMMEMNMSYIKKRKDSLSSTKKFGKTHTLI